MPPPTAATGSLTINTYGTDGRPLFIQIEGGKIVKTDTVWHDNTRLNLTNAVVLPQVIESHSHTLPFDLADATNLFGDRPTCPGNFTSRFEWRPLWLDKLRDTLERLRKLQKDYPETANCDLFYYTSMLNIGAAVIQGYDFPEYYQDCKPYAGEPLERVREQIATVIWGWNPDDRKNNKSSETASKARKLTNSDVRISHLAEGKAGDPLVEREIDAAYYAGWFEGSEEQKIHAAFIHGMGLSDQDLEIIKANNWGIIWSPVTQICLYGEEGSLDIKRVMDMGILIGLGSDWALTGSKNMFREMAAAQKILVKRGYKKEEAARLVLEMATRNNCLILGLNEYLGIKEGNIASLTFVTKDEILPSEKLDFENLDESDIVLVLEQGRAVVGDTAVMKQLDENTTTLPLSQRCQEKGVSKSVARLPNGSSFEDVEKRIRTAYPTAPQIIECE